MVEFSSLHLILILPFLFQLGGCSNFLKNLPTPIEHYDIMEPEDKPDDPSLTSLDGDHDPDPGHRLLPVQYHEGYRTVHWCIIGAADEPDLKKWPLNQFLPLLKKAKAFRHHKGHHKYRLVFKSMPSDHDDDDDGLYKQVHLIFKSFVIRNLSQGIREVWKPMRIEGLLLQANHNPHSLGLPTGQFLDTPGPCGAWNSSLFWGGSIPCRKKAAMEFLHPTVLAFHHLQENLTWTNASQNGTSSNQFTGTRSEIHANFIFHDPHCAETTRMEFLVMAVRNFSQNKFDVLRLGPFEVTQRKNYPKPTQSTTVSPSPFLNDTGCHLRRSDDIKLDPTKNYPFFEMSYRYDECIRNEAPAGKPLCDNPKQKATYTCQNLPMPQCDPSSRPVESSDVTWRSCEPCHNFEVDYVKKNLWNEDMGVMVGTRTIHGFLMIFGNFFILLSSIFVARFGKETLNQWYFWNHKIWYWYHMLASMMGCTAIYFGHFTPKFVRYSEPHTILGYSYCGVLGLCYFLAWFHHANHKINVTMSWVHSILGYFSIILALACVCLPYPVSRSYQLMGLIPKLLCGLAVATFLIFFIGMTTHVCSLDNQFGIKPKRRHFLTLEALFDTVPVPKANLRIVLFVLFLGVLFVLVVTTTFFQ